MNRNDSAHADESLAAALSGDAELQTRKERVLAGRILIILALVVVLVVVVVVLFGLPALTMLALLATALMMVMLIAASSWMNKAHPLAPLLSLGWSPSAT